MQKKIIVSVIAGKLAIGGHAVQAEGLGKMGSFASPAPQLSLDEVGAPAEILTPPSDGSKASGSNGVLYTNLAANQRIDFIINGIRRDRPVHVYLAYSKGAGRADQWIPLPPGQGQLELDPETMQILAGVTIRPAKSLGPFPPNPLGRVERDHEAVIVPIRLSDLRGIGADGEMLYFQVLAIPLGPHGEYQWELAQASEVDAFVIDRSSTVNNELAGKIGETMPSEGGQPGMGGK